MARVGSFYYGAFSNESIMMISDLDRRGYKAEAERSLELFLHYQGTVPLPGKFSTQKGILYGAGGYEFFLNNRPVQTTGEYTVQLLDQNGAVPLSDIITVNTFADCSKNLLLINFVQNH